MGYMQYARDPIKSVIVGIKSKGNSKEPASSYLGKLRGAWWALKDARKSVQRHPVVLWAYNKNMYQRVTRKESNPTKLLDVSVSQILAWIWSNFPSPKLSVKFVPRQYNEEANVLLKWRGARETRNGEDIKGEGVEDELAVNVSPSVDDYT